MRSRLPLPLLLLILSACGRDTAMVHGSLAGESGADAVWVLGSAERATVEADSFRLPEVAGDTLDLRFGEGDRELARMLITEIPPGAHLRLEGIWFEDEVAFPQRVVLRGGKRVVVNGLRMGGEDALPDMVNTSASVLAASEEALLVRPIGADLPDLRVVVTPGTLVRTEDGDPVDLRLEFGDSLRIAGAHQSGYVVATEIILPRASAARDEDERRSSAAEPGSGRERDEPGGGPYGGADARAVAAKDVPERGSQGRGRSTGEKPGKRKGRGKG